MGLGPNIIIRGFEQENYLEPMTALVAAGIMNVARLFLTRMQAVRDIVSVDSMTFMVSEGKTARGVRTFVGTSATLRSPCGRHTFLVNARDQTVESGTSWEVEIANALTGSAKASISLELRTAQKSAQMLDHALKERLKDI
jgi:hypothetical protein